MAQIPLDFVQDILDEEAWEHTEHIGTAPGTDNLGEHYYGVFEYEGKLYRCKYIEAGTYWAAGMGQWENPFSREEYKSGFVEAIEVEKDTVTTYTYEPKESSA